MFKFELGNFLSTVANNMAKDPASMILLLMALGFLGVIIWLIKTVNPVKSSQYMSDILARQSEENSKRVAEQSQEHAQRIQEMYAAHTEERATLLSQNREAYLQTLDAIRQNSIAFTRMGSSIDSFQELLRVQRAEMKADIESSVANGMSAHQPH